MNNTCFIYCRKSSEDSARQIQSIDDQKRVLHELALHHNLVVERIFMDEKSAGTPYQREGFSKMLKEIKKGKTTQILCWKIDRLSRNPEENGIISGMLQRSEIDKIITPDKTFLPTDNVLPFMVEGAMANQYLIDLSRNVKRGMQGKLERGVYPSLAPLGYINSKQKTIEPDPVVFPKLKVLWGYLIKERCQLSDLYRIMKKQYPLYGKKGQIIGFSSFHRIFQNQFYCGLFKWNGKTYPGVHKKVVTQSQFHKVQDFLEKKPKTRVVDHDFDFRGIFTCGCCGSSITAECKKKYIKTKGIQKKFVYYKCLHRKQGKPCKESPLSDVAILNQLLSIVESLYLPNEVLQYGIKFLNEQAELENNFQLQVEDIDQRITALEKKIKRIRQNIAEETDMEIRHMMKDQMTEHQIKIKRLEEDKEEALCNEKDKILEWSNQLEIIGRAKIILEEGLKEDKKELLYALGKDWQIKDKQICYTLKIMAHSLWTYRRKKPIIGLGKPSNRNKKMHLNEVSLHWQAR